MTNLLILRLANYEHTDVAKLSNEALTLERSSVRFREADRVATKIVNSIVLAKENIANDPEITSRNVQVHTREGRDASALEIENVVAALERVGSTIKVEGKVGQVGNRIAIKRVLAIPRLLSTDLRVEHFRNISGGHNERCACGISINIYFYGK
jgi:hypothetical protein